MLRRLRRDRFAGFFGLCEGGLSGCLGELVVRRVSRVSELADYGF